MLTGGYWTADHLAPRAPAGEPLHAFHSYKSPTVLPRLSASQAKVPTTTASSSLALSEQSSALNPIRSVSAVIEEDKIQVEHQEPTHVLNQEKQFKDAAAEKGQGFSGYEDLSLFQTISKFKVATLICFAVTLSAATDGYQVMPRRDSVNEQLADGRADWDSRQYRGQPRLCQSVRQRDRLRGCQNHWVCQLLGQVGIPL
jgi:hypothetical protein